jgi:hypothetical protein
VTSFRLFLRRHQHLALLVALVALLIRVVVPAGFMPAATHDGTITMRICSDTGHGPATMTIAVRGSRGDDGGEPRHGKSLEPCAYAGLAMPALGGADAVLLALALAFVLALAIRVEPSRPARTVAHLRPPLRGPPLPA